jgi:glycosyltransferase involved in cell wall biosynthesis
VNIRYDIVGQGTMPEMKLNEDLIKKYQLNNVIKCHGHLSVAKVKELFENANVGMSFVPIRSYYEGVRITKTLEYLLSGMPVIGTMNEYNKKMLKESTGVLCEDTPYGVAEAIEKIIKKFPIFNSINIRDSVKPYSIETLTKYQYCPYLEKIINLDKRK